jgi:uncharacterized protein YbjT (DUF2867 family)
VRPAAGLRARAARLPAQQPELLSHLVFVTGGTGYLGSALVAQLLARGHRVRALARPQSVSRLAPGCEPVVGDALAAASFAGAVAPADAFVQLVGTPHPGPTKGREFRAIDLVSAEASISAARAAGVGHFVYVSVAQPAPVMREYVAVRAAGEAAVRAAGLRATFLRPWYVLGPGHRWAHALGPLYWLAERLPWTRDTALRLGLVTRREMVAALVEAVERPAAVLRIVDVPEIRGAPARLFPPLAAV